MKHGIGKSQGTDRPAPLVLVDEGLADLCSGDFAKPVFAKGWQDVEALGTPSDLREFFYLAETPKWPITEVYLSPYDRPGWSPINYPFSATGADRSSSMSLSASLDASISREII
jgi:hypothetical protein